MNPTKELLHLLLHQIDDLDLTIDQRALARCRLAKHYEEIGNYEAAREAMSELWDGVWEQAKLEQLDQWIAAEVLLRVGTLTGWIGSTSQIQGAQETAKNLITRSIAIFESLGDIKKIAEAQTEIALCYEREGGLDDARVNFAEALSRLDDQDGDLKAIALLRSGVLEKVANRLNEALDVLKTGSSLFAASNNHSLKGRFHNELATVLKNLGAAESRADYIDRALIEFAAASFHFEQAGHDRYQACVENNLAMLFFKAGRLAEAHEHLDRAQALFTTLRDVVHQAQVAETRARVLLAEGKLVQAERFARMAVQLLENGDERFLLAEALTTYGITLTRLQRKHEARAAFERAIQMAEQGDDPESAGLAALTFVEQLPECLSDDELFTILERADDRLANTQNADLLRRMKNCFRCFVPRILWPNLPTSLEESVHRHEARLIRRALEEAGGVIRQAARLLKLSHQRLQKLLNGEHKDLRRIIAAIKTGKSEMCLNKDADRDLAQDEVSEIHTVTILHVEDDKMVAEIVKETLESQGWEVDTCANGNAALEKISSEADYDLFLIDYDLPGVNGLELVRRARNLAHRSRTPIVMLSASPVEAAAREAGAKVFLQKPRDVVSLIETITCLLEERGQEE
ncbi:MAG TPA: response regulator [Pyrinomonadaceae bacterium]|nr:response regulator [Pyrinomonadaceae bacterium]